MMDDATETMAQEWMGWRFESLCESVYPFCQTLRILQSLNLQYQLKTSSVANLLKLSESPPLHTNLNNRGRPQVVRALCNPLGTEGGEPAGPRYDALMAGPSPSQQQRSNSWDAALVLKWVVEVAFEQNVNLSKISLSHTRNVACPLGWTHIPLGENHGFSNTWPRKVSNKQSRIVFIDCSLFLVG
jgi:hypothetical protein